MIFEKPIIWIIVHTIFDPSKLSAFKIQRENISQMKRPNAILVLNIIPRNYSGAIAQWGNRVPEFVCSIYK